MKRFSNFRVTTFSQSEGAQENRVLGDNPPSLINTKQKKHTMIPVLGTLFSDVETSVSALIAEGATFAGVIVPAGLALVIGIALVKKISKKAA